MTWLPTVVWASREDSTTSIAFQSSVTACPLVSLKLILGGGTKTCFCPCRHH